MKKLKLSLANMEGAEVLTREQLKKVMGGVEGSGILSSCSTTCSCPSGYTTKQGTGFSVSIDCGRGSSCTAIPNDGVTCSSGTSNCCDDQSNINNFCKKND